MDLPIIGDVIREVGETVREFIPDADKRDEISFKLAELADKAEERENALLQGQIEVNKIEAGSSNLFVAGWRPYIGWTCGTALGWTWIIAPFLKWGFEIFHVQTGLPALPPESIFPVVTVMLGMSASRTYEKTRGVATSMGGAILTPVLPTPVAPPAVVTPKRKWFG